jgi:hypothetical protein
MFQTKFVEKMETYGLYSIAFFFFFFKSLFFGDNVVVCFTAGQATDDNMGYAHCLLDT